ncbi:MAG: hypothetical protein KGD57_06720 [Candidatus Lokiarchaeota archaeon]|nr:hypothetical protein [Candidatus Lokiarchaeota archaeon]
MIDPRKNLKGIKKHLMVFDTNIFLTGIDFNIINTDIYTIQEVLDEIEVTRYLQKNRNIINRIQCAIETNKLILKSPSEEYINQVKESAKKTNDLMVLSNVDIKIIALALELKETMDQKVVIYTNDYSMENLCLELNLSFSPLGKEGIKKKRLFEVYCPFCKIIKNSNELVCEICGSKLKRRTKENSKNILGNK